jgi:hypothetical protein
MPPSFLCCLHRIDDADKQKVTNSKLIEAKQDLGRSQEHGLIVSKHF